MTQQDDAAEAAGSAAYDRAQQSSWPPTKGDYEAVGSVAGAAAGAVIGGPIGAAIGAEIGTAVGAAVFTLGQAISQGLDPNRGAGDAPMFMQYVRTTVAPSPIRAAEYLALQCRGITDKSKLLTTPNAVKIQLDSLARLGVPLSDDGYALLPGLTAAMGSGGPAGVARARPIVVEFQRTLFAATAARVAECETYKQAGDTPSSKNSVGAVIVLGIVSAVGVGLIQKFITRGRF